MILKNVLIVENLLCVFHLDMNQVLITFCSIFADKQKLLFSYLAKTPFQLVTDDINIERNNNYFLLLQLSNIVKVKTWTYHYTMLILDFV